MYPIVVYCSSKLLCCLLVNSVFFPSSFGVELERFGGMVLSAERSPPPPPAVAPVHAFRPLACFLFVRYNISATPRLVIFHASLPSTFSICLVSFSALSTRYLIPVTCSVPSFFRSDIFRFVFFRILSVRVFLRFVCW